MRSYKLICCLVGVVSLGCLVGLGYWEFGKSSWRQPASSVPADLNTSENSAMLQGELSPHHGSAAQADYGTGPEVRLGEITLTAPATWVRRKPGSSYYMAEFALPHVEKDTVDGRLTVSVGSGSIESNVDVFEGEFDSVSESGEPQKKEIAGLQVTFVDITGEYTGQHGQTTPAATLPGYRMIVAVIPIGETLYFVKAMGPQQTIAANIEAINTFVGSVQRHSAEVPVSEVAPPTGAEVRVKPLTLTAPTTWKRTTPRSSLVQAEFALPHADKDTVDGRLTVSVVAGTVTDNVIRWKHQFVGNLDSTKQAEIDIGGLKATLVEFAGTFADQAGMAAPVVNRPDYHMFGVIIPIGDQLYVIKAVGPQQTISDNVDAITSFVESLKRDD